jgi:outer membrane protein assembly factor BamB
VVANGVIYVGFGDNLYALDAKTRQERWQFTTGGHIESAPTVANGVMYVGSDDDYLYALDT